MFVSARHIKSDAPSQWPLEEKIDIFASRILDWHLNVADRCINGWEIDGKQCISTVIDYLGLPANNIPHSGWAVLQIVLSYFETISYFKNGKEVTMSFSWGVRDVLGEVVARPDVLEDLTENLWQLRNGLYHSGLDGQMVLKELDDGAMLSFNDETRVWFLNPHTFVKHLQSHFMDYLASLKSGTDQQLVENFKSAFDSKHKPRNKGNRT